VGERKIEGHLRRREIVLTTSILYSVIYFVIVLGILVFIHEFGHFILAKKLGVGVITFSLGFGPKLIGKKIGETQYQISAVPLGGFVKLIGENREEEVKEEDRARSFFFQPLWKRALIIFAGPFFNLLLSLVIFCSIFLVFGVPQEQLPLPSKIGGLNPDLPAMKAGLKKGDTILSIDGISVSTWDEVASLIRKSEGKEITILADRKGKVFEFKVQPVLSKEKYEGKFYYIIGIEAPLEETTYLYKKVGVYEAISGGVVYTWFMTKMTVIFLEKIITGGISAKNLGGPIEIARQAGKQGGKGLPYLLNLIAVLGIGLLILNLLPIPILDGGNLLFIAIEAIIGKPISIKKMEIAQQIGLFFLILLFIFVFYNDIFRIFSQRGYGF
jgi:regulator of sigma E protease